MEIKDQTIDMTQELFIGPAKKAERKLVFMPFFNMQTDSDGKTLKERFEAIQELVFFMSNAAVLRTRPYAAKIREELLELLAEYAERWPLEISILKLIMLEADYCESIRDFEGVIDFCTAAFDYETTNRVIRYSRLNNLGHCLNFYKRFEEAEEYLRRAIVEEPDQYKALKNLGVSLEHQCQFEEAAGCYVRATKCSSDQRALMHLKRLVERYPSVRRTPGVAESLIAYSGSDDMGKEC